MTSTEFQDMWDAIEHINIHIMGAQEKERRQGGAERMAKKKHPLYLRNNNL